MENLKKFLIKSIPFLNLFVFCMEKGKGKHIPFYIVYIVFFARIKRY